MPNGSVPSSRDDALSHERTYFKEMRFRQLRAFYETARQRNFSKAADLLGISRPSIWQQVRALERELGASLVQQRGHGVELTEAGILLLELATPVVDGFGSIKEVFAQRRGSAPKHLSVATTSSLLAFEMVSVVREFEALHPDVQLHLFENPSRRSLRLLEDQQVDLALVGFIDGEERPSFLDYHVLGAYPFIFACCADHPLAKRQRLDAAALVRHRLILPAPETNSRILIDRFFARAGLLDRLQIALEVQSAIALPEFIEMGFGACLVTMSPVLLKRMQAGAGKKRRLVFHDFTQRFGLERVAMASRAGRHQAPHVKAFMDLLKKHFARS